MIISNVELAALIGELTGSKITSMSYGAALAVFRDDSKPCTVDDVAELLRGAMQHPSRKRGKKLAEFVRSLCTALYEECYHNEPIPPLPDVGSEKWNIEWLENNDDMPSNNIDNQEVQHV